MIGAVRRWAGAVNSGGGICWADAAWMVLVSLITSAVALGAALGLAYLLASWSL